jgi:hypothetical protein
MSTAKARVAGTWVDTNLAGYARVTGAWQEFGPEISGPAYESIMWPNEPSIADADDGADYNMGLRFHLLQSKLCYGVRWRVPSAVENPAGGHVASIWDRVTETRLAFKSFVPVPGGYQDILFDTPILLDAAPSEYVASMFTRHYVFSPTTPSVDWLVQSPSLNVRGDLGKLSAGNAGTYPASNFNSWYYVSPLIGV